MDINQPKSASWFFASKSKPTNPPHETIQYLSGETSCNCNRWTRHVEPDGSRSCTHTRMVESGCADDFCAKKIDHTAGKTTPTPIKAKAPIKEEIIVEPPRKASIVVRAIKW